MKRGKKFLLYISSMAFCCLMMLFFVSAEVDASSTFTCIDKETGNVCDGNSYETYYRLDKISVDSNVTTLELPSTYNDVNVEEIASDVIESSQALNLDTLILPANLEKINDNAFSNIESLKELTIPTSVSYIGASIFKDGANVKHIYLNHYTFSDISKNMYISEEAFSNISLEKIISNKYDSFEFYAFNEASTLKNLPVVTTVVYKYYSYQNEELTSILDTKTYYIGKEQKVDEIPNDLTVEGLMFLGWHLKKINGDYHKVEQNGLTYYEGNTKEYSVYPHFKLNELSFAISSVNADNNPVTTARYNGRENLLKLSVGNLKHDLIDETTGETVLKNEELVWNKIVSGSANKISNNEYIYLDSVFDSGIYECEVKYSYTYQEQVYYVSDTATITISITKAPLYVIVEDVTKTFGTYLTESDIEYTVKGLLWQDKVNKITKTYRHTGEIMAGNYPDDIKVDVDSIHDGVEEKLSNYDVLYSYGEYIVNPKVVEVFYDENRSFTYGDNIEIRSFEIDPTPYEGNYFNEIIVTFIKEPGETVGEYTIEGVKSVNNPNYRVNFNKAKSTGIITINPYKVKTYVEVENNVYDGNPKVVSAYYKDINDVKVEIGYSITYSGNNVSNVVNAGDYLFSLNSIKDENYVFEDDSESLKLLTIYKAAPHVDYKSHQTFKYTGETIYPNISVNNDEQTPIFICAIGDRQGDYCKNAGTYNVTVEYEESANYTENEEPIFITLTIEKVQVYLTPRQFTFYYREKIEAMEEININGETVIAEYYSNDAVGNDLIKYPIERVVLKDKSSGGTHNNYVASVLLAECREKIEILPRPVTIVFYNYENLVYDGKEKTDTIGIYAIDNISGKVVNDLIFERKVDEGIIKDAGTYHLRAYYDNPYYTTVNSNLLVLNVAKAKHDVSHISFKDQTFVLNFKKHSIYIQGALPEGVSVEYSIDGEKGNGVSFAAAKKVVAKFIIDEKNYMPIDNMEATIRINMVWFFVTMAIFVVLIGAVICACILYMLYRRAHPKKIKLKIKTIVKEDLDSKRVATSVKDVLGDKEKEEEIIEDENDLIVDSTKEDGFIERIYAANSELKYYYSEVKNELLSYEGITHTTDRKYEVFYHGTRQIAKLSICNNILRLYVNLDPSKYDKNNYNHADMSDFDCHARTPLRINVNTTESLRNAKVFIRILRKKENLKAVSNFVKIDYEKFYTLKENIFPRLFKKMFSSGEKKKGK